MHTTLSYISNFSKSKIRKFQDQSNKPKITLASNQSLAMANSIALITLGSLALRVQAKPKFNSKQLRFFFSL